MGFANSPPSAFAVVSLPVDVCCSPCVLDTDDPRESNFLLLSGDTVQRGMPQHQTPVARLPFLLEYCKR